MNCKDCSKPMVQKSLFTSTYYECENCKPKDIIIREGEIAVLDDQDLLIEFDRMIKDLKGDTNWHQTPIIGHADCNCAICLPMP